MHTVCRTLCLSHTRAGYSRPCCQVVGCIFSDGTFSLRLPRSEQAKPSSFVASICAFGRLTVPFKNGRADWQAEHTRSAQNLFAGLVSAPHASSMCRCKMHM